VRRLITGWVPIRVLLEFSESRAGNYAAALAFSCFLSMFPLVLGILSLVGIAVRDPGTEARAQTLIIEVFPAAAQPQLIDALRGVKHSAGWMGLLSLAGLLWSAGGIFSTMEFAFAQIFGTKQRGMVRQKVMGLVMMVLLVVAVGVTVAANAVAALFPLAWASGFVIGSAAMIGVLVLLYRFVPQSNLDMRGVVPGAVLAGILIEVFSLGFPLYVRFAGGFNTYGAQFGLFFLLAAWLYVVCQLILLGAVYNRFRLREPDLRSRPNSARLDPNTRKTPPDSARLAQDVRIR
jgi:membrane protein